MVITILTKHGSVNLNFISSNHKIDTMKKTIFYMLAGIVTLAACEKNTFQATERTSSDGKALVKIGMFSMPITATPQLVYDNGVRISSAFSAPYPYPGGDGPFP